MAAMSIDELIKNRAFQNVFQPVHRLNDEKLIGFESLIRTDHFLNPMHLFQQAKKNGKVYDLDIASIDNAISVFDHGVSNADRLSHLLHVNVFPSTLVKPGFLDGLEAIVDRTSIPRKNIILEINESEKILDMPVLKSHIRDLRDAGFVIGLDDVGKGESTLRAILEIQPDIIKLDRYFSIDLAISPYKQRFLRFMADFFDEDASIVLEGIEEKEDLEAAKALGIGFGQGFLLGKPSTLPLWTKPEE